MNQLAIYWCVIESPLGSLRIESSVSQKNKGLSYPNKTIKDGVFLLAFLHCAFYPESSQSYALTKTIKTWPLTSSTPVMLT